MNGFKNQKNSVQIEQNAEFCAFCELWSKSERLDAITGDLLKIDNFQFRESSNLKI